MSDSALEAPGKPTLAVLGDVYGVTWSCGIAAELERISEHRDELSADLTIHSSRPPQPGLLHQARFNLMSTQTRATLARQLATRDGDLDWYALLEAMCFVVREAYRAGDPTIDMREYVPSGRPRSHVEPYTEHGGTSLMFGDGAVGKTKLAIGVAVTAATGHPVVGQLQGEPAPVQYVDYETNEDTFHEDLAATCAGAGIGEMPPVFYRRQLASLPEAASALRREIIDRGIGLVVIDSVGMACGGDPMAPDVTLRFFSAVRSLEVPTLLIDHIAKNATDQGKAFGSVYKHNAPRLTWRVERAPDEEGDSLVVALIPTKRNNGRRLARRGYRIEFESDASDRLRAVRFRPADLARDFPERATLRQRILAELGQGPMPVDMLAGELAIDEKQVSSRVGEMVRRGEIVRLEDRRVALAARVSA